MAFQKDIRNPATFVEKRYIPLRGFVPWRAQRLTFIDGLTDDIASYADAADALYAEDPTFEGLFLRHVRIVKTTDTNGTKAAAIALYAEEDENGDRERLPPPLLRGSIGARVQRVYINNSGAILGAGDTVVRDRLTGVPKHKDRLLVTSTIIVPQIWQGTTPIPALSSKANKLNDAPFEGGAIGTVKYGNSDFYMWEDGGDRFWKVQHEFTYCKEGWGEFDVNDADQVVAVTLYESTSLPNLLL